MFPHFSLAGNFRVSNPCVVSCLFSSFLSGGANGSEKIFNNKGGVAKGDVEGEKREEKKKQKKRCVEGLGCRTQAPKKVMMSHGELRRPPAFGRRGSSWSCLLPAFDTRALWVRQSRGNTWQDRQRREAEGREEQWRVESWPKRTGPDLD